MRKPPTVELKNVPEKVPTRDGYITQERKYEMITPLFGGGVRANETDPITVINGKSVRGQLRFWWRATRGGQFGNDLPAMRKRENLIWGAASTEEEKLPSLVQIIVTRCTNGTEQHPFTVEAKCDQNRRPILKDGRQVPETISHSDVAPSYAAFPLQPQKTENKQIGWKSKVVRSRVMFTMKISYPADKETDILAALWAWETFGGIGARTRKGFGAVRQDGGDLPADARSAKRWLEKRLRDSKFLSPGQWPESVPHLSAEINNYRIGQCREPRKVMKVWKELIDTLRIFRQMRNRERGRSQWPEPNAIRVIRNMWSVRHEPPNDTIERFPRAVFGLPIVFHFIERRDDPGEPVESTLVWDSGDRLSSPLILKPLACANGEFVGLAAVLDTPQTPPGGLVLEWKDKDETVWERVSSNVEGVATLIIPLNRQTDVLKAFLDKISQE